MVVAWRGRPACRILRKRVAKRRVYTAVSSLASRASDAPGGAARKIMLIERVRVNLDAVARTLRRHITAVADHDRIDEMLVQMIHVFEHAVLQRRRHADIVEQRNMLDVLA